MGCSELVLSNLVGPLTVAIKPPVFELLANHTSTMVGTVTGHIESLSWSFGDGVTDTNVGFARPHTWTNAGTYLVTLTAYNLDNPSGVSSNLLVVVDPVNPPLLSVAGVVSNAFQFSFLGQTNLSYKVQYATNLTPPIAWQTLQFVFSLGGTNTIQDSSVTTNDVRFYQVQTQ